VKERVLTAVVLLAIVVGALFLDPTGWAVKALIVVIAGVCGYEFGRICKTKVLPYVAPLMLGLMLAKPQSEIFQLFALVTTLPFVPLIILGVQRKWEFLTHFSGTFWIIGTSIALYALASAKSPATWPLLLTAAIPIWCGDTAAIFVGKAFGKHKLAPSISPNKTWEGAIGNLLACVGAALALGAIFHYPILLMVLLGLNCGILGQAGDLFESWLKRKADVKDSGNILPGHGGLLDRLDSLMATAPLSLLILQSLVVPGTPK
jgi:phosphatidate cytidylyltransferase